MKRIVSPALFLLVAIALLLLPVFAYDLGYQHAQAEAQAKFLACGDGWYQTMGALHIALDQLDAQATQIAGGE